MAIHDAYTQEEIDYIIKNYSTASWEQMLEDINKISPAPREKQSIIDKACKLGVKRSSVRFGRFTPEEDLLIKSVYETSTEDQIVANLNDLIRRAMPQRSLKSVQVRASKNGFSVRKHWEDCDIDFLIKNYFEMTLDEIATALGRTHIAVYNMVRKLGLRGAPMFAYTEDEIEFISQNYLDMSDDEIGAALHRRGQSIKECRRKHQLYKPHPENVIYGFNHYVHRHSIEWRKLSAQKCGYKCVITGDSFDEIHHLYSRNLIIGEVIKDYPQYADANMNDLEDDEKNMLIDCFTKRQSAYPLGVCLRRDYHVLFHSTYGYGNNTPEQFYKFVEDVAPERLEYILDLTK